MQELQDKENDGPGSTTNSSPTAQIPNQNTRNCVYETVKYETVQNGIIRAIVPQVCPLAPAKSATL